MKWLTIILLLCFVSAARFDGFCNRTGGESCMNHPDCTYCNISMDVDITYSGTYALVMVDIKSHEPSEVPLILSVRKKNDNFYSKAIDIGPLGTHGMDVRIEREEYNSTVIVELKDRDIGTAWSYKKFELPGLGTPETPDILVPVLGVFAFLGILFFGFKQIRKRSGPYFLQPVFAPSYPAETPEEEEIIIVPRKKKYYYKKN